MMKRLIPAAAVLAALALPARHAAAQSVGQDVKHAGQDVGEAGKKVGQGTAKVAKKGAGAVKDAAVRTADNAADAGKSTAAYVKARVKPSKKHRARKHAVADSTQH